MKVVGYEVEVTSPLVSPLEVDSKSILTRHALITPCGTYQDPLYVRLSIQPWGVLGVLPQYQDLQWIQHTIKKRKAGNSP